jgi:hypothetical protein
MTQGVFSRARFMGAAAASSLLAACSGGGAGVGPGNVFGGKQSSGTVRTVRRLSVRSKSKKVAFPQPRPDGSIPPLRLDKARHKKTVQPGDGGDGGGTGGGGGGADTSTADFSYSSSDGFTSYSYDSSNYGEVYDSSGDLGCQMYGYDSSGYSYDIVDSSGTSFSMDMPDFPGDISGNTYTFSVDGGSITVEFSSSSEDGKATYQSSEDGKATSVTTGQTSTADINFDGSGQSYHCQLARLWQATVVAAIIVSGGVAIRYAPGAAGKTGGGIGAGTMALEQFRVSRAYLAAIGCG